MIDHNDKQWDAETIEREMARGLPPIGTRRLPPAVKLGASRAAEIVADALTADLERAFEDRFCKKPGEA